MGVDGVMRKVKSSQGVSGAGGVGLPLRAGSTTPKIAKKTLPASGSAGVNVPPPPGGRIAGKTLPKKSPIVGAAVLVKEKKEKDTTATPEKIRKTMSNGSVGATGGTKPKMKIAKAGGKVGGIAGKTVPVPGKRAVSVASAGAAVAAASGGGGGGDGEGGVPRKRPKVGGD